MIKTSKLLKRVWIVVISVIAITLMSFAVSFATEAQETAVDNPQTQDQTAVAEEVAVAEEAAPTGEDAVTPLHVNFNVSGDTSIPLYCRHTLKVDGVEQPDEYFEVNLSEGITFKNKNITSTDVPNVWVFSSSIDFGVTIPGSENEEYFDITFAHNNETLDVYFDGKDDQTTNIKFQILRYKTLSVEATLYSYEKNEVIPYYPIPFYLADGTLYDIFTTDENGKIQFDLSKDQPMGYFYKFDKSENLSVFGMVYDYYSMREKSAGVAEVHLVLIEPDMFITGNEHHSNFIYNLSVIYDEIKLFDISYCLNDFITSYLSLLPPMSNDALVLDMVVDGNGTIVADMEEAVHAPFVLSIAPFGEAGYAFDNWNVMGKTYGPNSKFRIDTSDFKKGDVVDMQVNYKFVGTDEGTEIAQTSDTAPLAAGVVAAFAVIAGLSLLALRKQH